MYEVITFTHEILEGTKTALEWEGRAFGAQVGGTTILTRGETGLIQTVQLYHRPLSQVLRFSEELRRRLRRKLDPSVSGADA
jgi:hypothetical protein